MKKKQDLVGELMRYGIGFALSFLIITGLAIATAVFVIVLVAVSFFDRVLH